MMGAGYQLQFPSSGVGEVLFRRPGKKRWMPLCPAAGDVAVPVGNEYKLRLHGDVPLPSDIPEWLTEACRKCVTEVEAEFLVGALDWKMDRAFVVRFLEDASRAISKRLAGARVILKPFVIPRYLE